jgi:hypothetical protein
VSGAELTALLFAVVAVGIFAYHSLGLVVLLRGWGPIPDWARQMLMPGREPANGVLRILSIAWVTFMTAVGIWLVAAGLLGWGLESTAGTRVVFAIAAALMIAWAVLLWSKYRSGSAGRHAD